MSYYEKWFSKNLQNTIILGGGCFWCLDAVYRNMNGIIESECGYANGLIPFPTYKMVCQGNTGYNEVVKITYETEVCSLKDILSVFFQIHDPTTLNRQGNDVGTQYRSGIYFDSAEQEKIAIAALEAVKTSQIWAGEPVTEIVPLTNYYPAEAYHQNYFPQNLNNPYCTYVVGKKVELFKTAFAEFLKKY